MKFNHALVLFALLITSGCSVFNSGEKAKLGKASNDVTGRYTPVIEASNNQVKVMSPEGSIVFSYNPNKLVDIDNGFKVLAESSEQKEKDIEVINTAIRGAFDCGYYELLKREPLALSVLPNVEIAKPIKIADPYEHPSDQYIVTALKDDKAVAAFRVVEREGQLVLDASMLPDKPINELPSITDEKAMTEDAARGVANSAIPGYSTQSEQQLERVFLISDQPTSPVLYNFYWRVKGDNRPYFIAPNGAVFKANDGFKVQSSSGRLDSSQEIKLERITN